MCRKGQPSAHSLSAEGQRLGPVAAGYRFAPLQSTARNSMCTLRVLRHPPENLHPGDNQDRRDLPTPLSSPASSTVTTTPHHGSRSALCTILYPLAHLQTMALAKVSSTVECAPLMRASTRSSPAPFHRKVSSGCRRPSVPGSSSLRRSRARGRSRKCSRRIDPHGGRIVGDGRTHVPRLPVLHRATGAACERGIG